MPFDYESFMTGVITGLKLGRVPKGRQPPVPSGRYILTESGEHILTEKPQYGDVSIYDTGVWYDATRYTSARKDSTPVSGSYKIRLRVKDQDGIEHDAQFAYANNPNAARLSIVFISNAPIDADDREYRIIIDLEIPGQSPQIDYGWDWSIYRTNGQVGGLYYSFVNAYLDNSISLVYRVTDAEMFEGTVSQFEYYLENLKYLPMITEGG